MARYADGRVRLLTRKGNNFSNRFPQIVAGSRGTPRALLPDRWRGDRNRPEGPCGVRPHPGNRPSITVVIFCWHILLISESMDHHDTEIMDDRSID